MTARKTGPRPSKQAAPAAGAGAAPLRGGYYVIRPGGDGPEYWPAGLDSLGPALDRLVWLSCNGSTQQLAVRHGRAPLKTLFEYADGLCTLRPANIIPADRTRKGA